MSRSTKTRQQRRKFLSNWGPACIHQRQSLVAPGQQIHWRIPFCGVYLFSKDLHIKQQPQGREAPLWGTPLLFSAYITGKQFYTQKKAYTNGFAALEGQIIGAPIEISKRTQVNSHRLPETAANDISK
jgi:hypothetical protein